VVVSKGFLENEIEFSNLSEESLEFFVEHGYVVLSSVFREEEMEESRRALEDMRRRYADDIGLDLESYDERICQWRDMWMTEPQFNDLLRDSRLIQAAQFFMRQPSIQLIHDHVIRKPFSALNSTIPWHQDFPFWPVDTPDALSTWTPMEDVSTSGGCLEIVDKSHKWGISPPVDFIMDPMDFSDRKDVIRIPVKKGSMVVLHSLTWHRTNPNEDKGTNRPAHISLWMPSFARYRPDLSDWHPVNDYVSVEAGEHLNVDKFPRFGEFDESSAPLPHSGELHSGPLKSENTMDMFSATPRIAGHIHRIIGDNRRGLPVRKLVEYANDKDVRRAVFERSLEKGIVSEDQENWLEGIFDRMLINSTAYIRHRARNVYNDAYAQWWFHVGVKWVHVWNDTE
jgi:ectoine hydroxylase-related dioxygenase (phytanoyl-CoA dioxygenase family)